MGNIMKAQILLLSESLELQIVIRELLINKPLQVAVIDIQHLMASIYQSKPAAIIIDVDGLNKNALLTIQSALAIEYIPTICIASTTESNKKSRYIKNCIPLPYEHMATTLPLLIEQAIHFMVPYKKLAQTYDAIDLMNEELKSTVEYYIKAQNEVENEILASYFKAIYSDNMFLDNQPHGIWLVHTSDEQYTASLFMSEGTEMLYKLSLSYCQKEPLLLNDYIHTGFIKNLNKEEYSDANNLQDILPEEILKIYSPNKNIVIFGINQLMIIAFDYKTNVTQFETYILKALAIKIDLMKNMKMSMKEVESAYIYTMNAIARAAEGRDDLTGHHIKRVSLFTTILAEKMELGQAYTEQLMIAAQMHDVGKIYIDDAILLKPGKLTLEEFNEMKKHTLYGQMIIGESSYLTLASEIARSHHEKYDGSGYPDGKMGDGIPLGARIVSLADIYDALRSARSYKPLFTHEQAYDIIVTGDGRVEPKHFDPKVLQAFIETHEIFNEVYNEYADA